MEWFESIGQWFVDNKDAIVMFVTSSNFVGFIANIVLLIKGRKIFRSFFIHFYFSLYFRGVLFYN